MSTTEMKEIINKLYANVEVMGYYLNNLGDADGDDDLCEEVLKDLGHALNRMSDRINRLEVIIDEAKGS